MDIIILYGLPGSGKSFYSKKLENDWTYVLHMDDYIVDGKYEPIKDVLKSIKLGFRKNTVVIDSIITTNDKLMDIIKECYDVFGKRSSSGIFFKVVYWNEDREACKENVKRRDDGRNVSVTIENLPFEDVNEYKIRKFVRDIYTNNRVEFEKRYVFTGGTWGIQQ